MEQYRAIRKHFEDRMKQGSRPQMYLLQQCANGEYMSPFTETAWREYLAGWLDCEEFSQ